MENINIGLVNLVISEELKRNFFDKNSLNESEIKIHDFFNVIKKSPLLQTEFKVFNNIENKQIDNDVIATRYIDNNLKLFESYTLEELNSEHKKLKPYLKESFNPENYGDKIKLYESINNLIIESLKLYDDVDVDKQHESFTNVLNHIKTNKKTTQNNSNVLFNDGIINETIIKIAVDKFNEKYDSLSDNDKTFLKEMIVLNKSKKRDLFETLKKETIGILENIENKDLIDRKHKALEKIKTMEYNKDTIDNDIIKIYEFKKGLL